MRIMYFIFSIALVGCSSVPTKMSPVAGKALLVAQSDGFQKVFVPLGTLSSSRFEILDGKKVSDFLTATKELNVEPGEHELVASCTVKYGGLYLKGEHRFNQSFIGGKVYTFKPVIGSGDCRFEISIQ